MNEDKHLEFNTEQLMAALRAGVNLNDCDSSELRNILQDTESEDLNEFAESKEEELYEEQSQIDAAYDLAALGADYSIGDLEFNSVIGNIVLLNVISSPLVSGELGDSVAFEDIAQALYIMYKGKDALKPVMSIQQRIQDLYMLKPLCKDNPEMCDRVMKKMDEISNARITFSQNAIKFYENYFTGEQLQEVFDKLLSIIMDSIKGIEEVTGSKQKKKVV